MRHMLLTSSSLVASLLASEQVLNSTSPSPFDLEQTGSLNATLEMQVLGKEMTAQTG